VDTIKFERMIVTRTDFNKHLLKTTEAFQSNENHESDNRVLINSFLRQSSHTEDNINAIQNIEYSEVTNNTPYSFPKTFGLKIKDKNVLLSHIVADLLEDDETIDFLQSKFPQLSKDELDAAMRICTVILMGFECDYADEADNRKP